MGKTRAEVRKDWSWGMMFHTAFRKSCDTDWSVIIWNAINVLSEQVDPDVAKNERVWFAFCNFCQKRFEETDLAPSEIVAEFVEANEVDFSSLNLKRSSALSMFVFILKMTDKDTWSDIDRSFAYYEEMDMA